MFYDNFKDICKEKGTTPTTVLRELGLSTGSTGRWKTGSSPTVDIVCKIAEYLGVSLDSLINNSDGQMPAAVNNIKLDYSGTDFYNSLKRVCHKKGTGITAVLRKLHMNEDYIQQWKNGVPPSLDVVCKISAYLDVSIDYIVSGSGSASNAIAIDSEWNDIISHIPDDRQQMCKDFLRTHMVIPDR